MGTKDKQTGVWLPTAVAMTAFAANSVLCRMALHTDGIDAASFTTVRLVSGAAVLMMLSFVLGARKAPYAGTWLSGFQLFLYAVSFSFAYVSLNAGTGALILFGSVQATMIISGLLRGERPHILQWAGVIIALTGLVYLVFPGITAPSPRGTLLMTAAGIAWGLYSLRGRSTTEPLILTTGNFIRSAPFALALLAFTAHDITADTRGILLALLSGSVASGMGYVVWYAALRGLSSTRAATVQLSVPVLAAFGGVLFLSETVTIRLLVASVLILGGIAMTVLAKELKRENGDY